MFALASNRADQNVNTNFPKFPDAARLRKGLACWSVGFVACLITSSAFSQSPRSIDSRSSSPLTQSASAAAATALVPCPNGPVSVTLDNGAIITWSGREENACKRELKLPNGETVSQLWYGPTFTTAANSSASFAKQLKPWTLWPLQVGKTFSGRFDGPGADPGYQGSWTYKITVDERKQLNTKAGAFEVFVVTREEQAIAGSFKSKLREWYAPALGVSLRTAYTDNTGVSGIQEATKVTH